MLNQSYTLKGVAHQKYYVELQKSAPTQCWQKSEPSYTNSNYKNIIGLKLFNFPHSS